MFAKIILPLLLSLAALAHGQQSLDPAARLQDLLQLEAMSGQFTQGQYDESGELLQQTQGEFSLQQGQRFIWQSAEPYPQTLQSDGITLWYYDPDLEQLTIKDLASQLANTPMAILTSKSADIAQHYQLSQPQWPQGERFVLIPRDSQNTFVRLQLDFVDNLLRALVLEDQLQQRTELSFSQVKAHAAKALADFVFRIPEGTDIIDEREAPRDTAGDARP